MKAETLKEILEHIPDDYEIKYVDRIVKNTFTIDVDNKILILE